MKTSRQKVGGFDVTAKDWCGELDQERKRVCGVKGEKKEELVCDVYVFGKMFRTLPRALRAKKSSTYVSVPQSSQSRRKSRRKGQQRREKPLIPPPLPASLVGQRYYPSYHNYTMKLLLMMAAFLATNRGGAFVLGPTSTSSTTSTRRPAPVHRARLTGAGDDICVHL